MAIYRYYCEAVVKPDLRCLCGLNRLVLPMRYFRHMKLAAFVHLLVAVLMLVVGGVAEANCVPDEPEPISTTYAMPNCEGMAMDAGNLNHKSTTHDQPATCHFNCLALAAKLDSVAPNRGLVTPTYSPARRSPLSGIHIIPQTPPPRLG